MTTIKIAEGMMWRGLVVATHYAHPGLAAGCSACRLVPAGWCGYPPHDPVMVRRHVGRNIITNVGLNMIRDVLDGGVTDGQIKYMAWGSDNTAAAATDTTLGTEDGRKAITSRADGGTGVQITTVYLAPEDANQTLEELGWFAGPAATATVDTGIMVARVLYPGGAYTKDNLESIQLQRTDTFS